MTEEHKQALIDRCNYLIGGAPEIDVQLAEFALAALTQPASQSENVRHDALCDTNYARGVSHGWNLAQNGDSEGMRKCIESRTTAAMSALAQPASTALKLPDAKPDHDSEDGNDIDYLEPSQVYALGVDDGLNRCLREVVKLNAPHTAPIEPICATGGAEWVSNERVEEIIYRAEMFGHGAGYLPNEVIPMAKELLAMRKAFSEPYGWITEYPSIPAGIGGMTYSFHDNRQDAQEEAEAYDGFAVAVIRKP